MLDFIKKLFAPAQHWEILSFGQTDTGMVRDHNEDAFSILGDQNVFIVADGMGGHNAGEVASRVAIESLSTFFLKTPGRDFHGNNDVIRHTLISSLNNANDKVINLASSDNDLQGMGCTLVACYIGDATVHTCHVGDARCYIADADRLEQITNDHSSLAAFQQLSDEDDRTIEFTPPPPRHVITRAIGFPFSDGPEYNNRPVHRGNRILLCSDGLWSMLEHDEIHGILINADSPESACNTFITRANEEGGKDNITALVVFL